MDQQAEAHGLERCGATLNSDTRCLTIIDTFRELFEQASDTNALLRVMLFSLRSLDVVRIIEEPAERTAATPAAEP